MHRTESTHQWHRLYDFFFFERLKNTSNACIINLIKHINLILQLMIKYKYIYIKHIIYMIITFLMLLAFIELFCLKYNYK